MAIASCPACRNTGYLSDRFCSCPFADTLRDRIEAAPEFAEFRRKRAEVDRMLARMDGELPRGVWSANGDHVPHTGAPAESAAARGDDPSTD